MSVAARWMNLEIIILNNSGRERQIYGITYVWSLKKNETSERIYKTETDSQT